MVTSLGIFFLVFLATVAILIVDAVRSESYPKKICIISPSGALSTAQQTVLNSTTNFLETQEYEVKIMPNALKNWNSFAGTDEQRVSDIQAALEDAESCSIILCARGGYGLSRTIDEINWSRVNDKRAEYAKLHPNMHPLRLVGYSDVTHLLVRVSEQKNMNYLAIHGPMPAFTDFATASVFNRIENLLIGNAVDSIHGKSNKHERHGIGRGKLVGGNLSILSASVGTATELDTRGKVLFIEEVGEHARRIDRMLRQLGRAGKFAELKGLVFGQFTDCTNDNYFPSPNTMEDIIAQAIEPFVKGSTFPIGYGFDFGHGAPNYALPLGRDGELIIDSSRTLSVL